MKVGAGYIFPTATSRLQGHHPTFDFRKRKTIGPHIIVGQLDMLYVMLTVMGVCS